MDAIASPKRDDSVTWFENRILSSSPACSCSGRAGRPPMARALGVDPGDRVALGEHRRHPRLGAQHRGTAERQHALVVVDEMLVDTDVTQGKAGQFGEISIAFRVQARANDIDDLDRSFLLGARLDQLLVAGANACYP